MKTTSPFDHAELINILSEGLSMDLFSKEEITQWADHFVLQDDEPDIFFIDLALSINKEAALTILNQNVRTMQATTTSRPLFGSLYKQATSREKGTTTVVRTLFGFVFDDLLTKPEKSFIYALDHAADYLEVSSVINIRELEEDVLTFLSIYKEYTIINYARWNVLDKQVEQALNKLGNSLGNLDNQRTKLFHSWNSGNKEAATEVSVAAFVSIVSANPIWPLRPS